VAVESHGLPTGIVLDGANRHDVKLLERTLQSIITAHPEGMNVCLDAGYVGTQGLVEGMGIRRTSGAGGKKGKRRSTIHYIQHGAGRWKCVIRG
jgi:hypothetical protein